MVLARKLQLMVAVAAASACSYYDASPHADTEPPNTADAGDSPVSGDLPCDVADVVQTCVSCHSDPPRAGAPMPLASRADLLAPSPFPGSLQAERALARMTDQARPMPPAGVPGLSSAQIARFEAWIDAGFPTGMCGGSSTGGDAGTGPQPTTCTSGEYWPGDWDDKSPDMNPGLACRACHLEEEEDVAYFFMGTVFPSLHEEDLCYSDVPAGTEVHIVDRNNDVALRLPVRRRGNFFSLTRQAGVLLPFTARVVDPQGRTIAMSTPQMSGDCNGCHTEQGANGAPGRILLPSP